MSNCFDIDSHTVTLVVDDGTCVGTDSLQFDVISACEAVESLIHDINSANLVRKNKRPLLSSLKAACASFERENSNSAINQLQAFQNKVRAQIARNNPVEAARFTASAQAIIDALTCARALDKSLHSDDDDDDDDDDDHGNGHGNGNGNGHGN